MSEMSGRVARACAGRGLLFKRSAYNFPSLAHDEAAVDRTLGILDEVLHHQREARIVILSESDRGGHARLVPAPSLRSG